MKRHILIGLAITLALGGGLAAVKFLQIRAMIAQKKVMSPPPETVSTIVARVEQWPEIITSIGSVNPAQGVMISPEIAGTVTKISFDSGAQVQAGDLLVSLDVSSEKAQIRAAEAQMELARLNADRARRLFEEKTVSQADLDQAIATWEQMKANRDGIQALIDKKTIRAPFSGQLGIRLVNLGELLEVGKPIVSLQSLSPVFVDFSLPQQELSRLDPGLRVRITTDTYTTNIFDGELAAMNPDLDAATRSVKLRARLENKEQLLRAGMFVHVEVILSQAKDVLSIPGEALLRSPFYDTVFIVKEKAENGVTNLVAQQQIVRIGRSRGDFVDVLEGLKPGDRVVKAGAFKIRNGSILRENNEDTPKPSLTPNPPNG